MLFKDLLSELSVNVYVIFQFYYYFNFFNESIYLLFTCD